MHIVHLEDFFHPDAGYQLNMLAPALVTLGHKVTIVTSQLEHISPALKDFFNSDNVAERDKLFTENTGVTVFRFPIFIYYSGRSIYKPGLFNFIDKLKPDILFVHGEDTYIGIKYVLKSNKLAYPILFDCHMLEMASKNKLKSIFRFFYRQFIGPIINKRHLKVIRVVDTDFVNKHYGISLENAPIISLFGTDINLFKPVSEKNKFKTDFLIKHNLSSDTFIILYAGKLDIEKNGLFFAETIIDTFDTERKIAFVVIGNTVGEYGAQVESIFNKSKNIIFRLPTQPYTELPAFFSLADLFFIPKQCGMIFFDVQACGVPVLFEKNEINIQRAKYNNAFLFNPQDISDARNKIADILSIPESNYDQIRKSCREHIIKKYNYYDVAKLFEQIIENEIKEFNS